MDKFLNRNLITFAFLGILVSCTTVSTQEETRIVDTDTVAPAPAAEPVALPEAIEEPTAEFTREPPVQTDEKQTSIKKGSGVFVREVAGFEDQDFLYALSLYSNGKPYQAADLPDHPAFDAYRAYVLPLKKGGQTLYRLRLGFFDGYSMAKEVKQQLQQYFPDAWIVEVTQREFKQSVGASISEPTIPMALPAAEAGNITLKFEAADLREFVRVVFEDILKQGYMIDPKVIGKVTLHTSAPIKEDAIVPILESVLQQNGAALIYQQGIYKVIPICTANPLFCPTGREPTVCDPTWPGASAIGMTLYIPCW